MTTNGPIYRMVEERIVNLYGLDAQAEGNTDYISRCQELESLLPHIEEIEPVWIPVEERLPVKEGEYLTCSKEGKYRIAFFRKAINHNNDWYFYIENRNPRKYENSFILVGCEKWMPLPPTK